MASGRQLQSAIVFGKNKNLKTPLFAYGTGNLNWWLPLVRLSECWIKYYVSLNHVHESMVNTCCVTLPTVNCRPFAIYHWSMGIFSDTSLQMMQTVNPVHIRCMYNRLHKQIVWPPCGWTITLLLCNCVSLVFLICIYIKTIDVNRIDIDKIFQIWKTLTGYKELLKHLDLSKSETNKYIEWIINSRQFW